MKKILLLITLIISVITFAQTTDQEFENMVEAEMKSAAKLQNITVNPNTLNYDITYHQLKFTVDPAVYFIAGEVTTTFTALSDMNTITFDMANELTVTSVTRNGISLSFSESGNNELVINFPTAITNGTSATVVITYSGVPPVSGFSAFAAEDHAGVPVLWTLSEPFGAKDWWPCKQDLNDKINNIDVYITAPSQYTSVSNGLEISQSTVGSNKTTHFQHNYPIPAYLIAIAVTNYQIFTQTAGTAPNDFPIVNYIYPENFSTAQTQLAQTLPIMNLFETLFEPYPFHQEKYGHAQFGWGGGMEHTTVSFMGNFGSNLIAHELAHQWFGNKITCGTWKDIWLNEGFAEYLSGLVVENINGPTSFVSWKNGKINNITSQPGGAVYLTDTEALNVGRIFSGRLSYNKGSMVVHMLRWKMGDAMFFQALKNYLADPNLAFDYAVTSDLKTHLEAVYGSSLTEFFNDWVFNQGYPTYSISASPINSGQIQVTVNQTQSHSSVSFFEMPIEVRFTGSAGETFDARLENVSNGEQFIVNVPFAVTGVVFDPNRHVISKNNVATLSNPSFELQDSIILSPNPTKSIVELAIPDYISIEKIELFNTLGQLVSTKENAIFNVDDISTGLFIVKIYTNKGVVVKNLLKN